MNFNRNTVKRHLENFDLQTLFIEELGWDPRRSGYRGYYRR